MIFSINGCTIDTSAYEVRRGDTIVPVEPQVFDLLVLLLQNRDRVVTKDEIFECIWNGRAVSEATLNSRIKSVRQAIGDNGASQALIRTIRGRGFRVVGDVGEGEEGAPDPDGRSTLPEPSADTIPTRHALPSHRVPPAALPNGRLVRFRGGRTALSLAVALLLVALAGGYLVRMRPVESTAISAMALGMPRGPGIAVLRFAPVSAEPEVRFPADAIVEEIATNLTRFSELRVTAPALTTEQDGSAPDVTEVGRKLGVEFLLKGSVRRGGERLRVSAHLLRTSDGHLLWADTYDRVLTPADLFAIQDDIAGKVVATIASLAAGVIARETLHQGRGKPPRELGAYECIVRTNEVMISGFSAATHLSTRTCLEAAVAKEPDYATAWALLAWVHTIEFTYGYNRRPDTEPHELAQAAARRAIDLAPASPIARFAMARTAYILHDLPLFYSEATRALSLNPHDPLLLGNLGNWLAFSGRWTEGVTLIKKAMTLNPKGYPSWWHAALGKDHYRRGEFHEALAEFKQMNLPGWWWYQVELAYTYGQLGDQDKARQTVARLFELYPGFTLEKAVLEHRKFSFEPSYIDLAVDGLRKAGVPEGAYASDWTPSVTTRITPD